VIPGTSSTGGGSESGERPGKSSLSGAGTVRFSLSMYASMVYLISSKVNGSPE
jgi:hypothetical protein